MATYTYDPSKSQDGGIDQMRFELGDTVLDLEGITSPLCDEEYTAILNKYGKNWRKAKLKCLEAICMKLSYEVDTSVSGLSYSLSDRYNRWKQMLDDAKKEQAAINGVPRAGNPASLMPHGGTPYFYNDMQANRRKF
ncbi:MAG: hypothetical protein ACI4PO_09080 [Faecousia sp.]